jgi:hypothetical protein
MLATVLSATHPEARIGCLDCYTDRRQMPKKTPARAATSIPYTWPDDRHLMRVFLNEIVLQCRFILFAYEDLLAHWEVIRAKGATLEAVRAAADRTWFDLQGFVIASAGLARLLWAGGGPKEAERSDLRTIVAVRDDSPLRQTIIRDYLEHVDQRVDEWWRDSPEHMQTDRGIGPFESSLNMEKPDSFRRFDPDQMEFAFWAERFPIGTIAAEAQRILPLAMAASQRVAMNEDPRM